MDIISHGLWGGIAFGRKSKRVFWTSFGFGVAPDFLSFGIFTGMTLLGLASGPDWSSGPPSMHAIPQYVHILYDITHSLVVFLAVFFAVWLLKQRPFIPMLAWGLHILVDIPTHSTDFFPTPFLWPIFHDMYVDGIPWSHPSIFIPNILFLAMLYGWWFLQKKKSNI